MNSDQFIEIFINQEQFSNKDKIGETLKINLVEQIFNSSTLANQIKDLEETKKIMNSFFTV